jgi:hypothetical protein
MDSGMNGKQAKLSWKRRRKPGNAKWDFRGLKDLTD